MSLDLFSLKGRVALVTGGSRGIGKMIARGFLQSGAKVYISSRKQAACDATAAELSAFGEIVSLPMDVSTVEGAKALAAALAAREPRLDILVNNAGAAWLEPIDVFPEKGWDKVMDLNLKSPFFLTQAFAKRLLKVKSTEHRSIITITSANATAVSIARGEYCMSKAAASMMSKLFAARLSDEGIGVYEIQPGFIETDMTAPSKAKYDALIENGLTVVKRFGQPAEVGRIALTLASGLLPYTVGQPIQVDGGLLTVRY